MKASHRAVMVCSEFLLFKKNNLFELFFELFGGPPNKSIHVINYTLQRCNYYQIVNLTSVQSVKVVQKYFGQCLIKYRTIFFLFFFSLPKLSLCFKTAPETNQAENDIQLILKDFLTKISNMAMVLPPNG